MQFKINGYKLFRRDRNRFGEGLMLYLNEEIPCKFLNNHPIVPNAEIICMKCHQLKRKWLLRCYKPPTQSDLEFIASITQSLLPKDLEFIASITQSDLEFIASITQSDLELIASMTQSDLEFIASMTQSDLEFIASIAQSNLEFIASITQSDVEFIASITHIVDFYLQQFENLFIIGDLNMTTENIYLNDLLQIYDLTAYKKANLLRNCLYHFLTKQEIIFKH